MEVVLRNVKDLVPFSRNPKKHPDEQIRRLKKSMETFGYTQPILINRDMMVIAGHARLQAASEIGLEQVPTILIDLPYEKAVAYVIADNRLAELAEEDKETMADLLKEIRELDDFDLESIGFTEVEADDLINSSFYVEEEEEQDKHVSDAKNHEVKDLDVTNFDKYIINYSGGKDSTLVAMWAMEHLPKEKLILAYWDSGWQFPEDNAYVEYFAEKYQIETYMFGDIDNSRLVADIIKRGYPFYGNLWCQTEYKIFAIKKFQKYIKQKYGEKVLTLNGIRKEESAKRADYPEYSRQQGMYIWAPMRDWTNADLLEYFNTHDEKLLPLYKHANRTGCAFCPNMGKVIRQYLQTYHRDVLFEINRTIAQTGKSDFYTRRPDMMIQAFTFFNKPVTLSEKETTDALEFAEVAFSEEEFQIAFEPYKGKKSTIIDLRGQL